MLGWKGTGYEVHRGPSGEMSSCDGRIYSYTYRRHPPGDSGYERCITMSWCTTCREFSDGLVFISRDRVLWDALAGLPPYEREDVERSPRKILDYLDGLVRRGLWPPESPVSPADPAPKARRKRAPRHDAFPQRAQRKRRPRR
ncbi:hypothetical protein [Actinoplanes sp. NPDC049802]|uniref:hypothetical protein n=1 Tax=Actinoplanes sp. NPDC049802 TaxID=3154742 RepID=UPI0033C1671B